MPDEPERRYAFRCSIHGINWPYITTFAYCPMCEEKCGALMIMNPDESILTLDEARELLMSEGIPMPTAAAQHQAQAKKLRHRVVPNLKKEIEKLNTDLDSWAKEAPPWTRDSH